MAAKFTKDKGKNERLLKSSVKDLDDNKHLVFSFRHLCRNQGATFNDWQEDGMLVRAITRLEEYSKKKVSDEDGFYTIYNDFPPESGFTHPQNVPEDAKWARIHVNGRHVIAGHIVNNIFYVVFLDSNHKFWIVHKKHT